MKPLVPPAPPGPYPLHYDPLPNHLNLPDREGGIPAVPYVGRVPDHTTLPDHNGTFAHNSFDRWQSYLLTDALLPVADGLFPLGDYFIGADCGIYWRLTDPPTDGVKAPDWYFVADAPRLLNGQMRRSCVLWEEGVAPLIVLEYVYGDGAEERDRTPRQGKFWVCETVLRCPYYGIFAPNEVRIEMYVQHSGRYSPLEPNEQGRFPINRLNVQLGVWHGAFGGYQAPWLRWWDAQGDLLLTGAERADRYATKFA